MFFLVWSFQTSNVELKLKRFIYLLWGASFSSGDEVTHVQSTLSPEGDLQHGVETSGSIGGDHAWLAHVVERRNSVREVDGSSPIADQHSGF